MASEHAPDRRLLLIATVVGMLAIVALPLSGAVFAGLSEEAGRVGVSLLTFAMPATLVAAGRVQSRAWMMSLGVTLIVVLIPVVTLNVLTQLALLSILTGPIVASIGVGLPLRDVDLVAMGAFLGGGSIAMVGGFAAGAAGPFAALGVVCIASAVGIGVAATRLLAPVSR